MYKKKVLAALAAGAVLSLSAPLAFASEASLPNKFDLRDKGWSTVAKAQDPWGSCWAFGTLASVESNLMKQGLLGSDADLSEHHLVWFSATPLEKEEALAQPSALVDPEKHSQAGEGQTIIEGKDVSPFDLGAMDWTAGVVLANGSGPVNEKDFPYCNSQGDVEEFYDGDKLCSLATANGDWSIDQSNRFFKSEFRLKANEKLANPLKLTYDEDKDDMVVEGFDDQAVLDAKKAMMERGALVLSYAADASEPGEEGNSECFNYDNWAQYRDTYEPADHTVAIIGWDDTYPKENFENQAIRDGKANLPKADGAWIVKNSWGSKDGGEGNTYDWGVDGEGCFYLSYYDKSIESLETFEMEKADDSLSTCMQYDFAGMDNSVTDPLVFDDEVKAANVFTAPYDLTLSQVSCATQISNPQVDVDVYVLNPDATDPEDGYVVASGSGKWDNAGYHLIDLDEPVTIAQGEKFSVVESLHVEDEIGPGYELPVEVGFTQEYYEYNAEDEDDAEVVADEEQEEADEDVILVTKINPGESYAKFSGEDWSDCIELNDDEELTEGGITYGNALIKAFGCEGNSEDAETYKSLEEDHQRFKFVLYGSLGVVVIGIVTIKKKKSAKAKAESELNEQSESTVSESVNAVENNEEITKE